MGVQVNKEKAREKSEKKPILKGSVKWTKLPRRSPASTGSVKGAAYIPLCAFMLEAHKVAG